MRRLILILAALALPLSAAASARAQGTPICGSVEAFQRTHRWQDLPGCTEKRDYSNNTSAVTMLGRAKDAMKWFFENWEKGDIDNAMHGVGGAIGYTNGGDDIWASDPELAAARPAYDEMAAKVKQYDEWAPFVQELAQGYFRTVTMIEEARKGEPNAAQVAKMDAENLKESIDKAQRANVPDNFIVPGIGLVKPATVGEIKKMIGPLLGQAAEVVQLEKDADDRKWAPYTSKLSGDRLKFFNESYRGGTNVYGLGGKYLDTPEEFDTAPVMCTQTFTTDQLIERWTVRCWSFRGDRQVSGPRITSGYGRAPASAYR